MIDIAAIRERYTALVPHLDERGRRSFAASEARSAGYGRIAAVARATGIAASTIGRGLKELANGSDVPTERVRRDGGGRKPLTAINPTLLDELMALVSPGERGDPMSAAAMDRQKLAPIGGGAAPARPPDQPHRGRRTAQARRVQLAGQSQDA